MKRVKNMLKAVLASYVVTGLLLVCLTFVVYQFRIEESWIDICIIGIYLLSTFVGGFVVGKLMKKRKFLWGLMLGGVYIGLLFGISFGVYGQSYIQGMQNLIPIVLSVTGGMVGGMVA